MFAESGAGTAKENAKSMALSFGKLATLKKSGKKLLSYDL